jgi:hypothetical protein
MATAFDETATAERPVRVEFFPGIGGREVADQVDMVVTSCHVISVILRCH